MRYYCDTHLVRNGLPQRHLVVDRDVLKPVNGDDVAIKLVAEALAFHCCVGVVLLSVDAAIVDDELR